jgi:hypothetical protein
MKKSSFIFTRFKNEMRAHHSPGKSQERNDAGRATAASFSAGLFGFRPERFRFQKKSKNKYSILHYKISMFDVLILSPFICF